LRAIVLSRPQPGCPPSAGASALRSAVFMKSPLTCNGTVGYQNCLNACP
jgi:hypothetical protein